MRVAHNERGAISATLLWAVFYWIGLMGPQFSLYNLRTFYISCSSKRFSLSAASETLINTSVCKLCSSYFFLRTNSCFHNLQNTFYFE